MAPQPDMGRLVVVIIGAVILLALMWLGGEFFFQ